VPAVTEVVPQTWPTEDRHETLIVACLVVPVTIDVHEQLTVWPVTVQLALPVVTTLGAGPENRLDDTLRTAFWLSLGPALATVTTKVAMPLPGLPLVVTVGATDRSAEVCT